MITKRLFVLLGVIAVGMAAVFFLPRSAAQPTGIVLVLPEIVNRWTSQEMEISKKEIETLGKGTEFARRLYYHPRERGVQALVSIVLSGQDMANSIHRPERCLSAQGWTVTESLPVPMHVEERGSFPTTRLTNISPVTDKNGRPLMKDGRPLNKHAYTFYWFVGEDRITGSHWGRFFQDNKDRLLRGVDQRWAFITVTGIIDVTPEAKPNENNRAFIDRELRAFIQALAPQIHGSAVGYD